MTDPHHISLVDRFLCWIWHDWIRPEESDPPLNPRPVRGRRIVRWCRRCSETEYEQVTEPEPKEDEEA